MNIYEVCAGYPVLSFEGDTQALVTSLVYDSRRVLPGSLFAAIPGSRQDGHDYLIQAVRRGASALIVSRPGITLAQLGPCDHPMALITVADTRDALAYAASRFFGSPSSRIKVIACTGQSGRHTLASLIYSLWQARDVSAAYLEGMVTHTPQGTIYGSRTRPEAVETQGRLSELSVLGIQTAVIPFSKRDIHFRRAAYIRCEAAVLMNADAADSPAWRHFAANCQSLIVNLDDPASALLQAELRESGNADRSVTFGIDRPADFRAVNLHITRIDGRWGTAFTLETAGHKLPVFVGLPGRYNVLNSLAALALAAREGLDLEKTAAELARVTTPGRTEPVENTQDLDIYIDTAWTASRMAYLLTSLRPYCRRRLLVVCGSGGDRAAQARIDLGRTSGELADYTWLTVTNERSEGAASVVADLEKGIRQTQGRYEIYPERGEAIRQAILSMEAGDFLVICGKGNEPYSMSADESVPYSDHTAVRRALAERRAGIDGPVSG